MSPRRQPGKKGKRAKKTPLPSSYLIATEGQQTEVNYFKGFEDDINIRYSGSVESFTIHIRGLGKETLRVIEDIEDYKRTSPIIYEHVWAVFDKDDFPDDHFDNAINKAESMGIHVAWSNESFELWYCLHFALQQSALPRSQYNSIVDTHLKNIGQPGYSKTDPDMYDKLKPYMSSAIKNAEILDSRYEPSDNYSSRNPCTHIYKLVAELKEILDR
ncbi:RloB family protein [Desemzia sp. FAM 23991]|uniref:RloB family protein n=1 Tax=unclassified Desemzia TaxID=2685243 RepID=UPI003885C87C